MSLYSHHRRFPSLYLSLIALLAIAGSVFAAAPEKDPMEGQQPIPMMGDSFQFQSNTWARYQFQPADQPRSELVFSILDEVRKRRGNAWWMEIEIISKETEDVVTRVLLPETEDGPGDALKAIVQIEGYRPFEVPRKYLKPNPKKETEQVGEFATFTPKGKPKAKQFTCNGRTINGTSVEALDAEGRTVKVDLSPEVPPLGIVGVYGEGITMELLDWGSDASTKIEGKPVGLWRWIWGVAVTAAKEGGSTP